MCPPGLGHDCDEAQVSSTTAELVVIGTSRGGLPQLKWREAEKRENAAKQGRGGDLGRG